MTFDWHMLYPLHTVIFDNSQVFGGVPCKAQLCNFSKWFFSPRFGVVPIWELWQFCYVRIEPPKVEGLIQPERGQRWLNEISQGLRLSGNLRDLLHRQIRFLFIQGGRVARDLGMVDVDDQLIASLDSLRGDIWSCVLRVSTSPATLLLSLDPCVLDRGLGPVGNIPIPNSCGISLPHSTFKR